MTQDLYMVKAESRETGETKWFGPAPSKSADSIAFAIERNTEYAYKVIGAWKV